MRAVRSLLILMASTCAAANAWAEGPMTRASVLQAGKGSWTVDDGGPLGPVEVSMQRKTSGWEVKVHGMYPIVDARGHVLGIADMISLWLSDIEGERQVALDTTSPKQAGRWEPGQTFDATFTIPLTLFEKHPHIAVQVAIRDGNTYWPSSHLEPKP